MVNSSSEQEAKPTENIDVVPSVVLEEVLAYVPRNDLDGLITVSNRWRNLIENTGNVLRHHSDIDEPDDCSSDFDQTIAGLSRHNFAFIEEIREDAKTNRIYRLEHPSKKHALKLTVKMEPKEMELEMECIKE